MLNAGCACTKTKHEVINMNTHKQENRLDADTLYTQAYTWAAKLDSETCSEQEQDAFLEWIENADHAEAFNQAQQLRNDMLSIKDNADIKALRHTILANPTLADDTPKTENTDNVVSFFSAQKKAITAAFSVGFTIAASLLIFTLLPYFSGVHETGVGEIRTLVLDDGSIIMLDTDSSIRVAYSDQKRTVHLRYGRAHFEVAKNPNRPFTVNSNGNAVTAVGTAFSVNNINNDFIVRLNEGTVDITSDSVANPQTNNVIRLQEGEQWLAANKQKGEKQPLDTSKLNWVQGSLIFNDEPLGDVLTEINRYSDIKIHLANQQLAENKINAVFYMGKTANFANAIQRMLDLDLSYNNKGNIVLSR